MKSKLKTKKPSWADKQFGEICKTCGKRHAFYTIGENLPKERSKCEENK